MGGRHTWLPGNIRGTHSNGPSCPEASLCPTVPTPQTPLGLTAPVTPLGLLRLPVW